MNGQHHTADAEPAVATPRPTLTLAQRHNIWDAAVRMARAERSHQKAIDANFVALAEVNELDEASAALSTILADACSTEVNYDLLERTLERDELIGLRDRLTEQVERLMQEKTALQDQLGGFELEREGNQAINTSLRDEVNRLTERLHTQIRRNDELAARGATMEADRDAAHLKLKVFKAKVVQVAAKYATENGWCEVIDEALKELGLEIPTIKYATKVDITVYLSATLRRDSDMKQIPDRSWVADEFTGMGEVIDYIKGHLGLSGDHSDYSVDDVEYDVIEVTSNG